MQWGKTAMFELLADIDMHVSSLKVSRQIEHFKMIKTDAAIIRAAHRTVLWLRPYITLFRKHVLYT